MIAHAQFSTTTLETVLENQVLTSWEYFTAVVGAVWPTVLGVVILFFSIALLIDTANKVR